MSLINQVLDDLEKRGARTLAGGASVRAVPAQKNRLRVALLLVAVLALVFVLINLWVSSPQPRVAAPVRVMQAPVAKPAAVPQAESHPVAVAVQEASQEEGKQEEEISQETGRGVAEPAMRLSMGLGSLPLPSSLRVKTPAAATGQRSSSSKAALSPLHTTAADAPKAHAAAGKSPAATLASAAIPASGVGKQVTVQQQADNEFRKASMLMQQGHIDDAIFGYEAALRLDAGHDDARRALVGLLLKNKRNTDAESVLRDGLEQNPRQSDFAMLLARLQVERDALPQAMDTLQKTLPYAYQQADYQAFIAALLQRQNRHEEAISRYQIVLRLSPNSGVWLMGLGISLQAVHRNEEARDAFMRAIESRTLSAELQVFVEQRLKEL